MSSTITLSGDWLINKGSFAETSGTGNLGIYATGGVSVTANQVGLGRIDQLVIDHASGYTFLYVASTSKVMVFAGDGGVALHTHDLLVKGGQIAGGTAITAWYATDIFGKELATDKTILGSASATNGGVQLLSVAAQGAEIDNGTDITAIVFNWRAQGV